MKDDKNCHTETKMIALYETKDELRELFNDEFMGRHTQFETFDEFTFSTAVFVQWQKDFVVGDRTAFDCCVKGKTQFKTWQDMYRSAQEFKAAVK